MPAYLVTFYGPMTDEARGALRAAGLTLHSVRSGTAGGADVSKVLDGDLPEPNRHDVETSAPSGDEAVAVVRQALDGHSPFGKWSAQPLG